LLRRKELRVLGSCRYEEVPSDTITDREESALEAVFGSDHIPCFDGEKRFTMMNNQAQLGLPPIPFIPSIAVDNKPVRPAESCRIHEE